MKVRDLIALIEADGWFEVRTREVIGSFTIQLRRVHSYGGGQTKRGCATRNSEQRAEASWPKEAGVRRMKLIIEKGNTSYGAHGPDLPGCVAVGDRRNR